MDLCGIEMVVGLLGHPVIRASDATAFVSKLHLVDVVVDVEVFVKRIRY